MSVKRYFFNAGEANVWREENEAGDCVDYTDYASLLERCEKMETQLEAVKRLCRAESSYAVNQHDYENGYLTLAQWEANNKEYGDARAACLAVGIDPKEL